MWNSNKDQTRNDINQPISQPNQAQNEIKLRPLISQNQLTAHNSQTFLITCMDFRLIDDACRFMDKLLDITIIMINLY